MAARIEPLAKAGEVLITKELRFLEEVAKLPVEFTQVARTFSKDVGAHKAGDTLECFVVKRRSNSGTGLF